MTDEQKQRLLALIKKWRMAHGSMFTIRLLERCADELEKVLKEAAE